MAETEMTITLIGPVGLRRADQEIRPARSRWRYVLASLALTPGEVVPVPALIQRVWGDQAPQGARHLLYTNVSSLRRALGDASDRAGKDILRRVGRGYALMLPPEVVDLHRARRLAAEARKGGGGAVPDARAAGLLRQASSLWQGVPLGGLASDWASQVRRELEQERLAAAIDLFLIELRLGEHASVASKSAALLADHPLSEPLAAVQMLALYRSGRQADALAVYEEIRRRLVEETSVGPGEDLQRLHRNILRRDPSLDVDAGPPPWAATAVPPPPVPAGDGPPPGEAAARASGDRSPPTGEQPAAGGQRLPTVRGLAPTRRPAQLPADVAGFTGRARQLELLDQLLAPGDRDSPPTIAVIDGTGGVGKSALAVHWAQRNRDRFPDGQLYVDLYGYSARPPLTPIHALTHLLHALGLPIDRMPSQTEEAAAMYRTLVADRRILVLLDNASGPDQVRPLLPAGTGSRVLVTSRTQLTGLVAREGAIRIHLDALPPGDAHTLLLRLLDGGRVPPDPADVRRLAELCGYLPLALRIAAANVAAALGGDLRHYVRQLQELSPVSALSVSDDPLSSVSEVLAHSCSRLSPAARRMFRLLGAVPVPDLTADSAASLAGVPPPRAGRLLADLAAVNLVEERSPGRYRCHDLLRQYAAEVLTREGDARECEQAQARLYDYYLRAVDTAADIAYPQGLRLPRRSGIAGPVVPRFADPEAALRWLDEERANLSAAIRFAADSGLHYWAYSLADALRGYFWFRMHAADWEAAGRTALASAAAARDQRAEISANVSLAGLYGRSGRHDRAVGHGGRALRLARRIGWLEGQVSALGNLGSAEAARGKPARAIAHFRQSLDLSRRIGWRHGEATSLTNLGSVGVEIGDLPLALDCARSALALNTELKSANGRAINIINIAAVHQLAGRLDLARSELQDALRLCRRIGSSSGMCVSQRWLAAVELEAGDYGAALELANAAVAIASEKGHEDHEGDALRVIGMVAQRCGEIGEAAEVYRRAFRVTERSGGRATLGRMEIHLGLAETLTCTGDLEPARDHATAALAVARRAPFRHLEGSALRVLAELGLAAGNHQAAEAHATAAAAVHRQYGHRLDEGRVRRLLGHIRHALGDHDGARRHWHGAHQLLAGTGARV